jgi:hypothetical protein
VKKKYKCHIWHSIDVLRHLQQFTVFSVCTQVLVLSLPLCLCLFLSLLWVCVCFCLCSGSVSVSVSAMGLCLFLSLSVSVSVSVCVCFCLCSESVSNSLWCHPQNKREMYEEEDNKSVTWWLRLGPFYSWFLRTVDLLIMRNCITSCCVYCKGLMFV